MRTNIVLDDTLPWSWSYSSVSDRFLQRSPHAAYRSAGRAAAPGRPGWRPDLRRGASGFVTTDSERARARSSAASCRHARSRAALASAAELPAAGARITIRKTIDVMIATFCIRNGHVLLHGDRDFAPMSEHLGLRPGASPAAGRRCPRHRGRDSGERPTAAPSRRGQLLGQSVQHALGLRDVGRDRVHQRRRQAVVGLEAELLARADFGHLRGLGAGLDDRRDERRELGGARAAPGTARCG